METKEAIASELSKLTKLKKEEILPLIEKPKYANLGDFAFPCFPLAKIQKKNPYDIAMELKEEIITPQGFERVDALGGYLNFFLDKKILAVSVINKALKEKDKYGSSKKGKGKSIVIDYSSPNIAKPMTIGHLRSTIIGNSLYKTYSFLGYKCIGINFLGDYGTQFGKLIVAYRKWGIPAELKADPIKALLKLYNKFHAEAEGNPQLDESARQEFKKLESGDKENLAIWKNFRALSIAEFEKFYKTLGVKFDVDSGESFYRNDAPKIIDDLIKRKIAVESQGALVIEMEKDMPPLLIRKSDGATMYSSRDLAAAIDRYKKYKFEKLLYVVASEQNAYFKQLFKALELMNLKWAKNCHHVSFGMIYMPEGGKVSTRKGEIIFLEDVLEKIIELSRHLIKENSKFSEKEKESIAKAVGISALIYSDLSNDRIKDVKFDWDKILRLEGDSGPYLQYTYARAKSILEKAGSSPKKISSDSLGFELADEEKELITLVSEFPQIVESAAEHFSPNIIANYALKVSDTFNTFYEKCPVLKAEKEKAFRLALTPSVAQVLKNSMLLLGMIPLEHM